MLYPLGAANGAAEHRPCVRVCVDFGAALALANASSEAQVNALLATEYAILDYTIV